VEESEACRVKIASWRELRNRQEYKTHMARQPHGRFRPSAERKPSSAANRAWNQATPRDPDDRDEYSIIVKPKKHAAPPVGPAWWVGASREEFNNGIKKRFHHA
jgi:hypothetical protein